MTEQELFNVPVPRKTETYSPVSHKNIVEEVQENLDKRGMKVNNKWYNTNRKGTQVIGKFTIGTDVKGFDFEVSFRNSYDKSMSLAFVAGTQVMICKNGMIFGDMKFVRKHTGSIAKEMKGKVTDSITQYNQTMSKAANSSRQMKDIELDDTAIAELCGRFFMEQEIITSSQLNIVKDELRSPSFDEFEPANLWSLYNHVTYSLKENHPIDYIDRHQNLHNFVEQEFSIT